MSLGGPISSLGDFQVVVSACQGFFKLLSLAGSPCADFQLLTVTGLAAGVTVTRGGL